MFRNKLSIISLICLPLFFAGILLLSQPAHAAFLTVNKTADTNDGVCDADCSLREAIGIANGNGVTDSIGFNIGGGGFQTIFLTNCLWISEDGTTVDGTTQLPLGGAPRIILDGSGIPGPGCSQLGLASNNNIIKGLAFVDNNGAGIYSFAIQAPACNNQVIGNYFGLNPQTGLTTGDHGGVYISNTGNCVGSKNRIGGPLPSDSNLIAGSGLAGILVQIGPVAGVIIENNYIGTDASGSLGMGNLLGIGLNQNVSNIEIFNNVISGNTNTAIYMTNTVDTVTIHDNKLGTNKAGDTLIPSGGGNGISVNGLSGPISNVTINNNVVSGFWRGIEILGDGTLANSPYNIAIHSNKIGTNASGTPDATDFGNGAEGIIIDQVNNVGCVLCATPSIQIGTGNPAQYNILANNNTDGILNNNSAFDPGGLVIQNNYIGTNQLGDINMGNERSGIFIDDYHAASLAPSNMAISNNVISGNAGEGIWILGNNAGQHPRNITIASNKIGTNVAGTAVLSNADNGIKIQNVALTGGATDPIVIGGPLLTDGNIISGNGNDGLGAGVYIENSQFDANEMSILSNYIGTNAAGTAALANTYEGVYIFGNTNNILSRGNVVSGNGNNSNGYGWGISIRGDGALGNPDPQNIMLIQNKIGANALGNAAVPNISTGVDIRYLDITDGVFTPISIGASYGPNGIWDGPPPGGDDFFGGNLISGNTGEGIRMVDVAGDPSGTIGVYPSEILVMGNNIGTRGGGTLPLANGGNGIEVENENEDIGGSGFGIGEIMGNTIGANLGSGIVISAGKNYRIENNGIGTDRMLHTAIVGNSRFGIRMENDRGGPNTIQNNFIYYNGHGGIAGIQNYDMAPLVGAGGTITGNTLKYNTNVAIIPLLSTYAITNNTIDNNVGMGLFVFANTSEDPDFPQIGPNLPAISGNTITNNGDMGFVMVDAITTNYGPLGGHGHALWCANNDDQFDATCPNLGNNVGIHDNTGGQYAQGWFGTLEILFNDSGKTTVNNAYNVSAKLTDALGNEFVPDAYSQAVTGPVRGVWGHLNEMAQNFDMPAFDYHSVYTWPMAYDFAYDNGGVFMDANPYTIEVTTNCGTYTGSQTFQYTFDGDGTNDLLGANPPYDQDFQLPKAIQGGPGSDGLYHFQIAQVMSPVCGGTSQPPIVETCSLTPTPISLATDKDGKLEVLTNENGKPYVKLNWGEVKLSDTTADTKISIFMDYLAQDPDLTKNGTAKKLKTVFAKYLVDNVPQSELWPAFKNAIEGNMALVKPLLMTMGIEEAYRDYWPYLVARFLKGNGGANSLFSEALTEFNKNKEGFGDYLGNQIEAQIIAKDSNLQAAESCVKSVVKFAKKRNEALKQGAGDQWIFNANNPDVMAKKTLLPKETEEKLRALLSKIVETDGDWLKSDLESIAGDKTLRRNVLASALQNPAQSIKKTLEALKNDSRMARLINFYQTSPEVMELKRIFFGINEVADVANCVANPLRTELSQGVREIRAEAIWNMLKEDEGACNTNAGTLMVEASKSLKSDMSKNAIVSFINDLLSEESTGKGKALAGRVTFTDYYQSRQEQAKQEIIDGLTLEIYRNDKKDPIKTLTSKDPEYANKEYSDRSIVANNTPTVASYTYSIASKTQCDTNQNGKKGTAEIYPQIDSGQEVDVTLDYKLKVKEAYDEKFMAKLAELFGPAAYEQPMQELNGKCESQTKDFEDMRAQLIQKTGMLSKYFLSTDLGDLALELASCKTQDYDVRKVITDQFMGNNLYASFLGADIAMGQKTTAEIIRGILYDAGKKAAEAKALRDLGARNLAGKMEILQKTMDELTPEDKAAIKKALLGKEDLFKSISQAADLNIEVCEKNKACKIYPAQMDIFGDGTVELGGLISGTSYTVKFRLQNGEGKYAAPQIVKMKVTSGLPKADKSGFETKQKVILGDFKACNFDNTNDVIDVNDIRQFKDIISNAQERDYADIDGRGNFDINDIKQCLFRGTAVEALGLAGFQQSQTGDRKGVILLTTNDALTPTAKQNGEPAWIKVMDTECAATAACSKATACSEGVAFEYGCQDNVKQVTSSQLCKWGCDGAKCCLSDRCRKNYDVGQKCQDSDGGSNAKVKGEVTLVGTINLVSTDQCSGLHAVSEYTCDIIGKPKQTVIPCGTDEICSQAACMSLDKTPPQGGNEICGNGIDDDRDSLADCFDGQCSPGAGQTTLMINYCTLRTDEAVCCLYADRKEYEFKPSFQASDCQGAGRFHVATEQNCIDRATKLGYKKIGEQACVTEGQTIPVIPNAPQCCAGLTLQPPSAGIVGIRGTCVKSGSQEVIVEAGPDQVVVLEPGKTTARVTLDASGSTGKIDSFFWAWYNYADTTLEHGTVIANGSDKIRTTYDFPVGEYRVTLTGYYIYPPGTIGPVPGTNRTGVLVSRTLGGDMLKVTVKPAAR